MTTRRTFLGFSLAASVLPPIRLTAMPSGERRLRLGIVSDVHVKGEENKDLSFFAKTLTLFRDEGVDGVILSGDMADDGRIEQLQMVADAWREVFPDDRLPDGRHVERLFIYGNHDSSRLNYGIAQRNIKTAAKLWGSVDEGKKHLIAYNEAAAWNRCFGEEWSPIYAKTVKGYVFVGCHWGYEKDLKEWLKANADRLGLGGEMPFFYAQHPHPGGTCNTPHGESAWGNDGGIATAALSKFPRAGQKRVLSLATDSAIDRERPGEKTECLFMLDELPEETPIRFSVRPLNCFGVAGSPIVSDKVRLPL